MNNLDYSKFDLTTVILYPGFQLVKNNEGTMVAKPAERLICGMAPVMFKAYPINIKPENLDKFSPNDRYDFRNLEGELIQLTAEQVKGYQPLPQLVNIAYTK